MVLNSHGILDAVLGQGIGAWDRGVEEAWPGFLWGMMVDGEQPMCDEDTIWRDGE